MNKRIIRTEEVPARSKKDIGLKEDETFEVTGATDGHKKRVIITPVRVVGVYSFAKLFNFDNKNTGSIFINIYRSD